MISLIMPPKDQVREPANLQHECSVCPLVCVPAACERRMLRRKYERTAELQIARVTKMLADEYGTASNIKSRVNRLSVLSAITSAQQRLKLYNKVC